MDLAAYGLEAAAGAVAAYGLSTAVGQPATSEASEGTISAGIANEVTTATAAQTALGQAISAETTRAQGVEAALLASVQGLTTQNNAVSAQVTANTTATNAVAAAMPAQVPWRQFRKAGLVNIAQSSAIATYSQAAPSNGTNYPVTFVLSSGAQRTFRRRYTVMANCASVRLLFTSFWGSNSCGEVYGISPASAGSPANSVLSPFQISAAIEDPFTPGTGAIGTAGVMGGDVTGTVMVSVTFNGSVTATIAPGGFLLSDPVPVNCTAGTAIVVRTCVTTNTAPYTVPYNACADNGNGGTNALGVVTPDGGGVGEGEMAVDATQPGTSFASSYGGFQQGYVPTMILGVPQKPIVSVLGLYDSITQGTYVVNSLPGFVNTGRGLAIYEVAVRTAGWAYCNAGIASSQAMVDPTNTIAFGLSNSLRRALLPFATHVLDNGSINDFRNGQTAAALQAFKLVEWSRWWQAGKRVIVMTVQPNTDDPVAGQWNPTISNQNRASIPFTYTVRGTYNAWLRSSAAAAFYAANPDAPAGTFTVIDVASLVEVDVTNTPSVDPTNGGYWGAPIIVSGTCTTGSTTSVVNDTTKSRTLNGDVNYFFQITSGTGSAQAPVAISANSATSWTLSSALTTAPDTTSVYRIYMRTTWDGIHYASWAQQVIGARLGGLFAAAGISLSSQFSNVATAPVTLTSPATSASASTSSVLVTWNVTSATTGINAPTDFVVLYSTDPSATANNTWRIFNHAPLGPAATSLTVTGLTPSTTYYFQVAGVNSFAAPGAYVSAGSVTLAAAPGGDLLVTGANYAPVVLAMAPRQLFASYTGNLLRLYNAANTAQTVDVPPDANGNASQAVISSFFTTNSVTTALVLFYNQVTGTLMQAGDGSSLATMAPTYVAPGANTITNNKLPTASFNGTSQFMSPPGGTPLALGAQSSYFVTQSISTIPSATGGHAYIGCEKTGVATDASHWMGYNVNSAPGTFYFLCATSGGPYAMSGTNGTPGTANVSRQLAWTYNSTTPALNFYVDSATSTATSTTTPSPADSMALTQVGCCANASNNPQQQNYHLGTLSEVVVCSTVVPSAARLAYQATVKTAYGLSA